jgi:hypothetical protein
VVLPEARLQSALADGGLPCTIPELQQRFDRFLTELTRGKNSSRVRIVIERGSGGE